MNDGWPALARKEILEGLCRGEQAVGSGGILTQDEAKERMTRWLSASPDHAQETRGR